MKNTNSRSNKINLLIILLKRPDFLISAIAGALLLVIAYYWLLLKVSTLETTFANLAYEPAYRTAVTILVPTVLVLFGLNFALSILLFRAKGGLKWQGGSLLGALTGGFAAACPVCGAFLLTLLGVAGGLTALPFAGLEIWTVSAGIMGLAFVGSLTVLDKKTCDLESGKESCWKLPKAEKRHLIILSGLIVVLLIVFYSLLNRNENLSKFKIFGSAAKSSVEQTGSAHATDPTDNELFEEIQAQVLPEEGVTLPIRWGGWLPKLVAAGVIDMDKLEQSFANQGGLTEQQKRLFQEGSDEFITINEDNSWFMVITLWSLGLANQVDVNRDSPIAGDSLFNFASTGGWNLGKEENGGAYFNKYPVVELTAEQATLVKELAENSYRPCCNNSTFYQDCNHGSALLGLLELGAAQGVSREELTKAALVANSYWFPQNYLQTAVYMKVIKNTDWQDVNPEEILGFDYSSATGANKINQEVADLDVIPENAFGVRCGV